MNMTINFMNYAQAETADTSKVNAKYDEFCEKYGIELMDDLKLHTQFAINVVDFIQYIEQMMEKKGYTLSVAFVSNGQGGYDYRFHLKEGDITEPYTMNGFKVVSPNLNGHGRKIVADNAVYYPIVFIPADEDYEPWILAAFALAHFDVLCQLHAK